MELGLGISLTSAPRRRRDTLDPDAQTYIAAVETADAEPLEAGVKTAINDFVVGCKADGIWDALKASCILAGARTLNGCLVPLVGPAPTNFNFVSADYNRKTGLKGDGSTKYLNSNRNNNADPQDNNHNAVWISGVLNLNVVLMSSATSANQSGSNELIISDTTRLRVRQRSSATVDTAANATIGLSGASRASATHVIVRSAGASQTLTLNSQAPQDGNVAVFARRGGGFPTPSRFSFYSIGEAIDLAALDARVSTLMTALDGAIA